MNQLEGVTVTARQRRDRLGLFAVMYRQTTRTVRNRVAAGHFDDSERMCPFVERFAGRYLAPLAAYQAGQPVPRSWRVAFQASASRDTIILQHLLLGMNAHINLDLAVVAAVVHYRLGGDVPMPAGAIEDALSGGHGRSAGGALTVHLERPGPNVDDYRAEAQELATVGGILYLQAFGMGHP